MKRLIILISKTIYKFFCIFYQNIVSFFQERFLRISASKKFDRKKVFFSFTTKNLLYQKIVSKKYKKLNYKYQSIYILKEKIILELINSILNNEIRDAITRKTGYKYSVDYFILYENFHIPKSNSNRSIYANLIHSDKPYSKNMLKIIVPISVRSKAYGPIMVKFINPLKIEKDLINSKNFKYFISNKENNLFYAFKPSQCLHKATIPKKNYSCYQIMIQLNPSKNWLINSKLEKRQSYKEPKFTEFTNLFDNFKNL